MREAAGEMDAVVKFGAYTLVGCVGKVMTAGQ